MSKKIVKRKQLTPLLEERAASAERTRVNLHQALDRFEYRQLIHLSPQAKLTVRNLAIEAGTSKDTPLSRYRKDHSKAGEYRFPDIKVRFDALKAIKTSRVPSEDPREEKIRKLRMTNKILEEKLLLAVRANNLLDAENFEIKSRNRDLEEQNAKLRRESLKVVSFPSQT